jgi:hypothetical protein
VTEQSYRGRIAFVGVFALLTLGASVVARAADTWFANLLVAWLLMPTIGMGVTIGVAFAAMNRPMRQQDVLTPGEGPSCHPAPAAGFLCR